MNLEDTFASLRIENEEIKKKLEAIDLKLLDLDRKMQSSENVLEVGSKRTTCKQTTFISIVFHRDTFSFPWHFSTNHDTFRERQP